MYMYMYMYMHTRRTYKQYHLHIIHICFFQRQCIFHKNSLGNDRSTILHVCQWYKSLLSFASSRNTIKQQRICVSAKLSDAVYVETQHKRLVYLNNLHNHTDTHVCNLPWQISNQQGFISHICESRGGVWVPLKVGAALHIGDNTLAPNHSPFTWTPSLDRRR